MEVIGKRGFASDNSAGVHQDILDAVIAANNGHAVAYGHDPYTEKAIRTFQKHFGEAVDVYFVYNGTAANVLGMQAVTESFNSIVCAESAHIHVDECGAPEKFTGSKLLTTPSSDGKIRLDDIKKHMHGFGFEHHAQPKVVSITQATELGAVYSLEEIREITSYAHGIGLLVQMDGARLSNAAAYLNVTLKELTADAGIDILSFGGAKNGMMFGEAIVFFNNVAGEHFKYIRKQGMQLASKMRFIAVQFDALLSNDLWLKNASHSNRMARYLAESIRNGTKNVEITQEVETNAVFARVEKKWIPELQKAYFFHVWDEASSVVRWMTAFDTTEEDIDGFVQLIKRTVG